MHDKNEELGDSPQVRSVTIAVGALRPPATGFHALIRCSHLDLTGSLIPTCPPARPPEFWFPLAITNFCQSSPGSLFPTQSIVSFVLRIVSSLLPLCVTSIVRNVPRSEGKRNCQRVCGWLLRAGIDQMLQGIQASHETGPAGRRP